ncbi:MAG TPA: M1 family aminopeptidase, partial [Burkholderiales bacterium]|nr:M1 family aminopeptidase [Burkholderiales bacterium]
MKCAALYMLAVVALAIAYAAGVHAEQPGYNLDIAIDVPRARITGTATIDAAQGAELSIYRGDLNILSLTTGNRRITPATEAPDPLTLQAEGLVTVRYEGTFTGSEESVISEDTIVLRDIWYPVVEGTYRYRLTATLPPEFAAVSEADTVRRTETDGQATYSFDFPYPQRDWDGITFAASRQWVSRAARYRDVDLSVYLLRRDGERLDEMVRQAQHYLERIEGLLGRYPFKRLAIVENPAPVKYSLSMPTYVLLSQKSVASTVREDSALNHEITHQWIGNGVRGDYEGGNWVEGLTSYLSDHLEGETLGIAWERRQRMMAAYQNNVADRAPSPLSEFSESSDRPSRIIGYAKSAIVFHMLRRMLGDERFFAVMHDFVRENLFHAVSWTDIRKTFERATATDLGWFFDSWVDGVAMAELGLEGVSVAPAGNRHELRFTITQKPPVLPLTVPVTLYFERSGSETVNLQIPGERQEFHYLLDEKPVRIVLDEGYDIFRRLTPAEIPPTINTLLTRPRVTVIAPPAEQAKFGRLIDAFEHEGAPIA